MIKIISHVKYVIALVFIVILESSCDNSRKPLNTVPSLSNSFANKAPFVNVDVPKKLERDWWRSAKDQILEDIINQIMKQNLSLEQVRLRLIAAREQTNRNDFLPVVKASSDIQYSHTISGDNVSNDFNTSTGRKNTSYYNAQIDSSWEIPIYGQHEIIGDSWNANIAFAQADIDAIRASVISNAVQLYTDMRRLQNEQIELDCIIKAQKKIF
jgi:outer membrane protein TolC